MVGRKVLVNQHPMTVVGVAAPAFRGIDVGEVPSLWIPAAMSAQAIPGFDDMLDRRTRWMQVLGRLKPGVTLAQAQAGLQPWFKAMLEEDTRRAGFPKITAGAPAAVSRLDARTHSGAAGPFQLRRRLAQPLWVLFAATAVLLGLACLNVAGLFLARGSARDREISTRLALGASRGTDRPAASRRQRPSRPGRRMLGVALAPLAMRALIAFLPRDAAANALQSTVDARLLLFAFLVSVAAGVLSGFAPALQAGRDRSISSLRERGGTASGGVRLRKAIVTLQIAFTLILVIGAALFVRTLTDCWQRAGIRHLQPGLVRPRSAAKRLLPAEASQLIRRIHDEIRASPEHRDVGRRAFQLLTGGSWNNPMTIQSRSSESSPIAMSI